MPTRLELFDAEAGRALGADGAGLLVSVAGVPEAVADQGTRLAGLAAKERGHLVPTGAPLAAWTAARNFPWPPADERLCWRAGVRPTSCGRAIAAIRDRLPAGVSAGILASAASGTLRGRLHGDAGSLRGAAHTCRAALEGLGGYFVVLDASAAVRDGLEIWGGAPDGLDLMRELRRAHDPLETLNPGRYIPGL
jgi:FAD/FMN-containing dehydrogenase